MEVKDFLDRLARKATRGGITLLVGAGISRPAPTAMPTVPDLVAEIIRSIDQDTPAEAVRLEVYMKQFLGTPFEILMSRLYQCIDSGILTLIDCLREGQPNHLHRFIATCIKHGFTKTVVTTNFDNMIERALAKDIRNVDVRWTSQEIMNVSKASHRSVLFKAHGSFKGPLDIDISTSILTTVESIACQTTANTTAALESLFTGQTVVVLGYSGGDRLDVLPALRRAKRSQVIWVDHLGCSPKLAPVNTLPPHVSDILTSTDVVVRGDTTEVCRILGKTIASDLGVDCGIEASDSTIPTIKVSIPCGSGLLMGGFLLLAFGIGEQRYAADLLEAYLDQPSSDRLHRARAFVALGQAIELMGKPEQALMHYRDALEIYRTIEDQRATAMTLSDLGTCLIDLGDYEQSKVYQLEALKLGQMLNDAEVINMSYHGLAVLMEYIERRTEADDYYVKAIEAARDAGALVRLALGIGNRLINRSKMGRDHFISQKSLDEELELLELYVTLGMDYTERRGRHMGLTAFLFVSLCGDRAEETARHHPSLKRIGINDEIAELVTSFRESFLR